MPLYLSTVRDNPSHARIVNIGSAMNTNGAIIPGAIPRIAGVSALHVGELWGIVITALDNARKDQGFDSSGITQIIYESKGLPIVSRALSIFAPKVRLAMRNSESGLDRLIENDCRLLEDLAALCPNARFIGGEALKKLSEDQISKRPTLAQVTARIDEVRGLDRKNIVSYLKGELALPEVIVTAAESEARVITLGSDDAARRSVAADEGTIAPSDVVITRDGPRGRQVRFADPLSPLSPSSTAETQTDHDTPARPAPETKRARADELRKRNLAAARGE